MMEFILFLLKSGLLLGAALLLGRLAIFSAAQRHGMLAISFACVPLLLFAGALTPHAYILSAPQNLEMIDEALALPWPELTIDVDSTLDSKQQASWSLHDVFVGLYISIAFGLMLVWVGRFLLAYRWIGETTAIPGDEHPLGVDIERVKISSNVSAPVTYGILRPVVVVPAQWSSWSMAKRLAVLHHEQAHVRRHDTSVSFLAGLLCALFWFQPLMWIAYRALRLEAERACDDAVLSRGVSPFEYANQLIDIARHYRPGVALSMAATPTLAIRISALLNNETRRSRMSYVQIIGVVAAAFTIVFSLNSVSAAVESSQSEFFMESSSELMPIAKVAPVYPPQAKTDGVEGYVLVEFTVDEAGKTTDVFVVSAEPANVFDDAALAAVANFKYKPLVEDGQPKMVKGIRNRVTFRLPVGATVAEQLPLSGTDNGHSALTEFEKVVQKAMQDDDFEVAQAQIQAIKRELPKLGPSERAKVHSMAGYVEFSQQNYTAAIKEYEAVVAQQKTKPTGIAAAALFTLAQLNFVIDEYEVSIDYIQRWMEATGNTGPTPRIFMGQTYYQLGDYPAAISAMEAGIEAAHASDSPVRERWWALLSFLYYEQEQWADTIKVLERLMQDYPKPKYEERLKMLTQYVEQSAEQGT